MTRGIEQGLCRILADAISYLAFGLKVTAKHLTNRPHVCLLAFISLTSGGRPRLRHAMDRAARASRHCDIPPRNLRLDMIASQRLCLCTSCCCWGDTISLLRGRAICCTDPCNVPAVEILLTKACRTWRAVQHLPYPAFHGTHQYLYAKP